jgi:UDP-N-acetyl-D-mannosaminuronic acid transferase (WecB/TagA/CpsF family)
MSKKALYVWEWGGTEDGNYVGGASDKIGFYGTTPVAKQTLTNAAVATTVAISTTSEKWGFAGSTQANAIVALVNEMRAKLVSVGLMA